MKVVKYWAKDEVETSEMFRIGLSKAWAAWFSCLCLVCVCGGGYSKFVPKPNLFYEPKQKDNNS